MRIDLVLGHEMRLTDAAAEEIRVGGLAESKRGSCALLAEDDHIREVGVFLGRDVFAEDAACWEYGLDGTDD